MYKGMESYAIVAGMSGDRLDFRCRTSASDGRAVVRAGRVGVGGIGKRPGMLSCWP